MYCGNGNIPRRNGCERRRPQRNRPQHQRCWRNIPLTHLARPCQQRRQWRRQWPAGCHRCRRRQARPAGIIYNLAGAMVQLNAASNKNVSKSPLDSVIPQINAWNYVRQSSRIVARGKHSTRLTNSRFRPQTSRVEMQAQGKSDEEIQLTLAENVRQTQEWAAEVGRLNSQGLEKTKQQFDDIKSKVAGLITRRKHCPRLRRLTCSTPDQFKSAGLTGDSANQRRPGRERWHPTGRHQ